MQEVNMKTETFSLLIEMAELPSSVSGLLKVVNEQRWHSAHPPVMRSALTICGSKHLLHVHHYSGKRCR